MPSPEPRVPNPALKPYRVECSECCCVLLRGEFPRAPNAGGQWRCSSCRKLVTVDVTEETPPGSWDSQRGVRRKS